MLACLPDFWIIQGTKVKSGLHSCKILCTPVLIPQRKASIQLLFLGEPLSNSDSLHSFFSRKKTTTRGCPSRTFDRLCFAKMPLAMLASSPQDRQTNRNESPGSLWGGTHLRATYPQTPRDYMGFGYVNTKNSQLTAPTAGSNIRWRWRNVWLTQASYYLRWKRPDIVRKKHAKRYYYLLQNFRYHATKYVNIQKRVSQFLYCLATCKCVPVKSEFVPQQFQLQTN